MDVIFLSNTALFQGIPPAELEEMLHQLRAETRRYPRGTVVYHAGARVSAMGLVLSGSVSIENNDVWGNKSILDRVGPGQVFAEAYACTPGEPLMIQVVAAEPAEILFLEMGGGLPGRLLENLLAISARKNLKLSRRIFHTSSKSIRGRLLSYLSFQAAQQGSRTFEIPFNRQQLADYLSVDRSALSNELSKMRREGLLEVTRNRFTLLGLDPEEGA